MTRRAATALAVCAVIACGKPLATDGYRGAPIWSYEGDVQRGSDVARGSTYRMALFFAPTVDTVDPERMIELLASGTDVEAPSSFVLNVYEAPVETHMARGSDGKSLGYGVARILLYDDRDGDGRREPSDPFVSIAPPLAVLYLPRDFAAGEATGRGPLSAGFHVIPLPQPCTFQPPPPTTDGDCGVPLGESCDVDADCHGGLCLKETKEPWPAGYCIVPEPPPNGCRPGRAAYLHAPRYSLTPPGMIGFYARACRTDDDCGRTHPRERIYTCDPSTLACLPPIGGIVPVGGGLLEVEPVCAGQPRANPPPQ